jgi:hypothetical protein
LGRLKKSQSMATKKEGIQSLLGQLKNLQLMATQMEGRM